MIPDRLIKGKIWYNALLFLTLFVVVYFKVDVELLYHVQQPINYSTTSFWESIFSVPGSFSNWLGTYITELFYYPVFGSFTIALIFLMFGAYMSNRKSTSKGVFNLAPLFGGIVLSILVYTLRLPYFSFSILLQLLLAYVVVEANIFLIRRVSNLFTLLMLIAVVQLTCFYLLGGMAFSFSVLLLVIRLFSLNNRFRYVILLFLLLIGGTLPLLYYNIGTCTVPLRNLYGGMLFEDSYYYSVWNLRTLLFTVLIAEILLVILKNFKRDSAQVHVVTRLVGVGMLVFLLFLPFKSKQNSEVKIDYLAYNHLWGELIEMDKEVLTESRVGLFQLNRALNDGGNLLEKVFYYNQKYGVNGLFLTKYRNRSILQQTSDLYFDLGYYNESRHYCHEAFSVYGPNARILRRLVELNIILDRNETARKYIIWLKKSIVNRKWAIKQEAFLNGASTELVAYYRKLKESNLQQDFFANAKTPWVDVEKIYNQDPTNKKAFEYLVLSHLMNHQVAKIIELIPEFRRHNFDELPAPVQEAILIYSSSTGQNRLQLAGYGISNDLKKGFIQYSKDYMNYNAGKTSESTMKQKYSNTYCYYIHFVSPVNKKVENKISM